jgi:N-acetylmuramoyl-L-alanine amidase
MINFYYHESKYTLEYSKALYEALTEEGLKVKLTREKDEQIPHYGESSRTGIPYEVKAKLMLSIHLNSSNYRVQNGVEIYTAYNDNYDYAKTIAKNIVDEVGCNYSSNPMHKVMDGVYMRVYSKSDINDLRINAINGGYPPYENIPENATYYYFIRETGGIITNAFSDGRNPNHKANIYRNLNQGVEAYLCELGYISSSTDMNLILNKKDSYIKALKNSVLEYFSNVKDADE